MEIRGIVSNRVRMKKWSTVDRMVASMILKPLPLMVIKASRA